MRNDFAPSTLKTTKKQQQQKKTLVINFQPPTRGFRYKEMCWSLRDVNRESHAMNICTT